MKQMLLAAFSALCLTASAQATISNTYFPVAGDTLHFAYDASPDPSINLAFSAPGGPQTWDFTAVQAEQTIETRYQAASAGQNVDQFPGADLVVTGSDGETYFDVTSTNFKVLGFKGTDPGGFGLDVIAKFSPPITERFAPLNFFDIFSQSTFLSLPFSADALPDSLFGGIGITIDSIRVRVNTNRIEAVDGYGTVKIPGGQYDVLRLKRTEYTTTNLDVKLPFLGWVDISSLGGGGGGGFSNFLGTDTTITERFYSPGVKEEIAIVTFTSDVSTAVDIRYKDNATSGVEDLDANAPGAANIFAFPNPAVDWVRFDCTNLPPDEYTIKMFNIIGKQVWKETHNLAGNKSIRVDLNNFKKGTYLYSLVNKKGKVIGTKRLVIVKP